LEQPPYRQPSAPTAFEKPPYRQQQIHGSQQLIKTQFQQNHLDSQQQRAQQQVRGENRTGFSGSRQQLAGSQQLIERQLQSPPKQRVNDEIKLGHSYSSVPNLTATGQQLQQFSTRQYAANQDPLEADQSSEDEEDNLRPLIGRQPPHTAEKQQQQPMTGDKLAYQSEIRSIIQSYHDITGGLNPSSSTSSEDEDPEDHRRLLRQPWQPPEDTDGDSTEEYVWQDHRAAAASAVNRQQQQPRGGQNKMATKNSVVNRPDSGQDSPAESFRSRARRNASFKKAVSSQRLVGSLAEELGRSMEELHQGFVSLSRTSSTRSLSQRSGMNSRTESMQSLASSHR
jgi:hypothetical protein